MTMKVAENPKTFPMTPEHAITGVLWLQEMSACDKWDLSADEIADLLGGISVITYQDWLIAASTGESVNLDRDCLERISLLIGIANALQLIAPSGRVDLGYEWFNKPNDHPIFCGLSIKQYLLQRKNIEGIYTVRRYLNAAGS